MLAPRRDPRTPLLAKLEIATMFAVTTTSGMETSTRCATPENNAVSAANAASPPVCAYPDGCVQRTGARSGSPVEYILPLEARTPRSDARQAERGPLRPN